MKNLFKSKKILFKSLAVILFFLALNLGEYSKSQTFEVGELCVNVTNEMCTWTFDDGDTFSVYGVFVKEQTTK